MTADSTPEPVQLQQPPTVTHINVPQGLQKKLSQHILELSMDA